MATTLSVDRLNDPVTVHMHQDYTRLALDQTVGEALTGLRQNPPRGRIIYFYVVDEGGHLRGVVPTRRLILSEPGQRIADIMVQKVLTIPSNATVLDACEFFIQHRLLAFPVVNAEGNLLGAVDMELYTDELGQLGDANQRNDLFQLLGVHVARGRHDSPWQGFRSRFPWLGCNLLAGILAAILAGVFEQELTKVVALSFFIPVVLNLAESVSSQSVSLALQVLHGPRPSWRAMLAKLRVESLTGFFLGLGSGSVVALVAVVWLGQPIVALCILGGITGGVAAAALMGISIPVLLRALHLEPRVAAGPIALAGADVVTIVLYLNLARWLLA
jgi:magnesium transporter